MFTWLPLYEQIARKLLEFEQRQSELLTLLRDFGARGLQVGGLEDEDAEGRRFPLAEIDPFTFFAMWNWQGRKPENRRALLAALREAWELSAPVPEAFEGLPLGNPQQLWYFAYSHRREAGDVARLWQWARAVAEGNRATVERTQWTRLLAQRSVGEVKLSIGMFWLNPREFLPADKWMRGYAERRGVPADVWNGETYFGWLETCVEKLGLDFPKVSHQAFVEKRAPADEEEGDDDEPVAGVGPRCWLMQAGRGGEAWENFQASGDLALGFEGMEDFRSFLNREAMRARMLDLWPEDARKGSRRNATLAAWEFSRGMQRGDIVFLYAGFHRMLAVARVAGDYRFEAGASNWRHRRAVEWLAKGPWTVAEELRCPSKTLTGANNFARNRARLQVAGVKIELVDEKYPALLERKPRVVFTHADVLDGLFMDAAELNTILARLERKKNVILQGPPGVGKTFVARRLAYALMGEQDDSRVCMVQFHPSYGYEDFVQGYRPAGSGLQLRNGVFYEFARRARDDGGPCFFIIDEINRGNLAKIFGELLMLLEADKRGPQFAMPLTYSESAEETFWLPENLHVIGTMNTADRSLAMVDYALRRRFAFVTLGPALSRPEWHAWLVGKGAPPALASRIAKRLSRVNEEIAAERDLGAGFRIGHSYFCPAREPEDWEAWYREVVTGEVAPLLEEYFDKPARVQELAAALLAE